jgi:AcrR family transcriptional regulator
MSAGKEKTQPSERNAPSLSRERVCREALALVDEEGLDALSMRRLGARLGVEAMSLYRYVRDKADLLDALHAVVLGDLTPLALGQGSYRAQLQRLARGLRAALLEHPNVVALFATRPVRAPEAMVAVDAARAALERAGFAADVAAQAVMLVGVFTLGHVLGEAHGEGRTSVALNGAPNEETSGAAAFEFGLEVILDGLAARLGAKHPETKRRTK